MRQWQERDFEFEGNNGTYYIFPSVMPPIFGCDTRNSVWVPLFDVRVTKNGFEENLRLAIQEFRARTPNVKSVYCHVVRYVSCRNFIGIMCCGYKCVPSVNFAPKETESIDLKREKLLNPREQEDQWGVVHSKKEVTDKDWEDLSNYEAQLLANEHVVDDMLKFEHSLGFNMGINNETVS